MTDQDECELCGGCGEVSAMTQRDDRDQVGCPACIAAEKNEQIAALEAEIERLRAERDALLEVLRQVNPSR